MNILHRIMERKYRERIHEVERDLVNGRLEIEDCDDRFSSLDGKYIPVKPHQRHTTYIQTHLNFYHGVRK